MTMKFEYTTATELDGTRNLRLKLRHGISATIAKFVHPYGDELFNAAKERIARDGGTLFDIDHQVYLVGDIGQLDDAN